MIVYLKNKNEFIKDIESNSISQIIADSIYQKLKRKMGISEISAWENSLKELYLILLDKRIDNNIGISIEYNIPGTGKRIDFIISGYDENNNPSIILIELKQWQKANAVLAKDGIVTTQLNKNPNTEVVHPSYQVFSYLQLIKDFSNLCHEKKYNLKSCSYLHNYKKNEKNEPILSEHYLTYVNHSPIFFKDEKDLLTNFILENIKTGDNGISLINLDSEKNKPTKSLQNFLKDILKGNKVFTMIDTQKLIYENFISNLNEVLKAKDNKKVIIVKGGPGTGKTVLAINLLVDAIKQNANARYVSKNSFLRSVFIEKITENKDDKTLSKARVSNLLIGSGQFIDLEKNYYDVLIVDEAHRLNEKSGIYNTLGDNQIKEIINSSKLSIFFVDDNQMITSRDIGDIKTIKKIASQFVDEKSIIQLELKSQFRMNGSNNFLDWIDSTLGINNIENFKFDKSINYDFQIFDDPNELFEVIKQKNKVNNGSRVVAGHTWEWKSKKDSSIIDFEIGNFKKQWNFVNDLTWAINPKSIDQIGGIYAFQGLEFDYCGVLIGKDLGFENNKLVTRPEYNSKTDMTSLRGLKQLIKQGDIEAIKKADKIIRNTYRVLLTRGIKGCYVYFADNEVANYFKSLMD